MNCSDCNELYKERKQKPPCHGCPINGEMEAEQVQAEYLCQEEQAKAEAEEIARQEAEAEASMEQEEYEGGEWGN